MIQVLFSSLEQSASATNSLTLPDPVARTLSSNSRGSMPEEWGGWEGQAVSPA
jgi:hypothetical protein